MLPQFGQFAISLCGGPAKSAPCHPHTLHTRCQDVLSLAEIAEGHGCRRGSFELIREMSPALSLLRAEATRERSADITMSFR